MDQCPAVRWSSDAAHFSPTLCVLKIIVLKPQNKNSYKGPLRNSTRNIVPEASLVVVAIIMNDPTEGRPQGKGREARGISCRPFPRGDSPLCDSLKRCGLGFSNSLRGFLMVL